MRKLAHWLEEYSPAESIDLYRELAISHAREGGPVGERIAGLITRDKLRELCEFELDYDDQNWEWWSDELDLADHNSPDWWSDKQNFAEADRLRLLKASRIKECRQALAYFQKVEHLEIGIDKEEVAFQKFIEAEELCRATNSIVKDVRRGLFHFSTRVEAVIYMARRKIARILGDVPSIGSLDLRFGPGATRKTRKSDASVRRKLAETLQCSEDLFQTAKYVLEEMPHLVDIHSMLDRTDEDGNEWSRVELEVIPAKLSFVPKSAKTYRSICTEPGLNVVFQAGIGSVMAQRLSAAGIDIRDQTVNQNRAKEGSLTGELATLDLSSASDTIATEVVFELLPLDWASLLNRARSSKVILPTGEVIRQEKFSSMGNGFTFPLETLIFWGLAASCCRDDTQATVYGDDIVVPVQSYPLLVEVLTALGFLVNKAKSYHTGFFRESCGKDYYRGSDVRPFYPRGWASAQSLFVAHNYYVRQGDLDRSKRIADLAINPALRLYGPDGFGDGHLLGLFFKRRPAKYDLMGYSGFFFDTFVTRSSKDKIPLERGEYVVPLYTIYRRSDEEWDFLKCPTRASEGSTERSAFLEKFKKRIPGLCSVGPAPLPLSKGDDDAKALPLPGVAGYRKITVYTTRV